MGIREKNCKENQRLRVERQICAWLPGAAYYRSRNFQRVILYFLLVFITTWALWFGADVVSVASVRSTLFTVGAFMPGIVALALTYRQRGLSGARTLLARLVQWDVGGRWLAFALLFMATVKVMVALIVRVTTGAWPLFGDEPVPLMQVIAISVTVAWLFMKTKGSLFATMLLHAAGNNTKDIVPSALQTVGNPWQFRASLPGLLTLAILWFFAAMFMYDMRRDTSVAGLVESS